MPHCLSDLMFRIPARGEMTDTELFTLQTKNSLSGDKTSFWYQRWSINSPETSLGLYTQITPQPFLIPLDLIPHHRNHPERWQRRKEWICEVVCYIRKSQAVKSGCLEAFANAGYVWASLSSLFGCMKGNVCCLQTVNSWPITPSRI